LLEYEPLSSYPFILVCPRDHELVGRRSIRLRDLVRYPLLLPVKSGNSRNKIDRVFDDHGLLDRMNVALGTRSNSAVLTDFLKAGLGIAIKTDSPSSRKKQEFCVRSLSRLFGVERILMARKRGINELSHVTAFHDIIVRSLKDRKH